MYPETAPFKTGSGVLPDTIDDVPVGGHRSILYVNLRELRRHRPWVPGSRQIFLAAPVGLCPQGQPLAAHVLSESVSQEAPEGGVRYLTNQTELATVGAS